MGGNVVPPAYGAPPPDAFPSSGPVGFAPPPGARPISASPHLTTGPAMPRSSAPSGFVSNGPPAFTSGVLSGGPRFPSAGGAPQPPPQAPSMRSLLGSPAVGAPPGAPVQPAPPFSASAQGVSSPPGSYGPPRWPMQAGQVCNEYLSLCILFTF
jgi:protein transport protein SEC24